MPVTPDPLLAAYVRGQATWLAGTGRIAAARRSGADDRPRGRWRDRRSDRGEGVISAAIAVLVMAFLGAAMWLGFKQLWSDTEQKVNEKVSEIGS